MNKKGVMLLAGAVALSFAVCLTGVNTSFGEEERTVIQDGISINGTDVSGKTVAEAESIINDMVREQASSVFTLTAGSKSIRATGEELGLVAADPQLASRALHYGQDGNILYRFRAKQQIANGQGEDFELKYSVDNARVEQYLSDHEDEVVSTAVDGTLKRENGSFTYVPGKEGHRLVLDKSAVAIADYISTEWDGTSGRIELVTDIDEPKGSEEELSVVTDVLGSYNTNFSSSTAARSQNVTNGASKINGTLLYPGDEFSVATALNPMTAENGYAMAPSYENGQTVETYGGGICQVSTTLYNAVIRAELEVTNRSAHSMIVHYVEPSMDAAIAGTSKDFQFKNNTEYPVYLEGYTSGGIIYFNVYGKETRDPNREVTFESEVLSQTDPKNIYTATGAAAIGSISRTSGSAHTGYTARLWKIVTVNGQEQSRDVFNNSTYRSTDNVYAVGTASDNPEASSIVASAVGSQDLATIQSAISQAQSLVAQQQAEAAAAEAAAAQAEENPARPEKKQKSKKGGSEESLDGSIETPDDDVEYR